VKNAASEPSATLAGAYAHATRLLASRPDLAAEQAREILATVGAHPPTELLLAQAEAMSGASGAALARLQALAARHPGWGAPLLELGLIQARLGDGTAAIAALRAAVARTPALPQAWLALGDHLAATGDQAGADAAHAEHVRHAIGDPRLMKAASALAENRIPEAERLLREHLRAAPTDIVAIRMMGELAARIGRLDDAERLLRRAIELAPAFHAARQNLATVLHRLNRPEQALEQLERLLADDPRHPSARNLKAVVLSRLGDCAPAIAIYDELLREYPGHGRIWLSLGHALKTQGDRERAIDAYRRSIALEPGFGEAWWSLANLKTFRFSVADIDAMRTQLQRQELEPEQRAQFEFALGKAMEDAGEHASSFTHYERGNALRRQQMPYRPGDATARVQRSLDLFTADFLRSRAGQGNDAADPIFVIGLPRAGSTLVEQILSSHPLIEGTMELPEIIGITNELRRAAADGGAYHDVLASLDGDRLRECGQRYLDRTRVHRKLGRPFFIDKMPNNFLHVGLIHLILPNARIVDVRRHPLACCFSGFKQYFARGQAFSYGLDDIGRYYRDYVALMAHFDDVLPGRVHRVIYERLVEDTEQEVRRLLAYCGLPFDEQCLRFFENDRPVRTASSEQVRQPIYKDGVDHWRNFEPWLGPLKAALGDVLDHYPETPPGVTAAYRTTNLTMGRPR
jgi:tetratricopeptide (TPR) repeat protein